jgi:hypothetical protein
VTLPDPRRSAPAASTGILALILAATLAACAGTDEGSSPSRAAATARPTAATQVTTPAPAGPLVVDPSLLAILPASVGGVPIQPGTDAAANMARDASLAKSASGIAVGTAGAGNAQGADFATSTVVQLRPGIYSDAFYAAWRKSYDEAVCASAGGVSSQIRQFVGQHAVDLTVCGGGARTYHTHLAGDILISITAIGDRRFGGLVMAGLRR